MPVFKIPCSRLRRSSYLYKTSMQFAVSTWPRLMVKRKKIQLSVLPALAAFVCGLFAATAAGQGPERVKIPTVTLGIVSATNQTLIADHFGDFVRYVGGKL